MTNLGWHFNLLLKGLNRTSLDSIGAFEISKSSTILENESDPILYKIGISNSYMVYFIGQVWVE